MLRKLDAKTLAAKLLLGGLATALLSFYPIQMVRAENDRVNYEDPNLAFTDSYVSGANISCVGLNTSGDAADKCTGTRSEIVQEKTEEVALTSDEASAKVQH